MSEGHNPTPHDGEGLGVRGVHGPGSNVLECAANLLRLLGHNMQPAGKEMGEAAE